MEKFVERLTLEECIARVELESELHKANCWGYASISSQNESPEWTLGVNFEQAKRMLVTGWADMPYKTSSIDVLGNRPRIDAVYAEEGEELGVSEYLSGDEKHWLSFDDSETLQAGGKIIKVAASIVASCGVEGARIAQRGIAVTAIVESLESLGYNVELWVEDSVRGDHASPSVTGTRLIQVKSAADYSNKARNLFMLAHPAMLRRIVFRLMELAPEKQVRACGSYYGESYGACVGPAPEIEAEFDIYLPQIGSEGKPFKTGESARLWALEKVQAFIDTQKKLKEAA